MVWKQDLVADSIQRYNHLAISRTCESLLCSKEVGEPACQLAVFPLQSACFQCQLSGPLERGLAIFLTVIQVSLPSGYRTHEPRQLLLNYIPSPRVIFYPGKKPNRAFSGSACRLLVLAYESLGSSASTTEPPPNNNKDTKYPLKKLLVVQENLLHFS